MSKKKQTSTGWRFININLTAEQKAAYKANGEREPQSIIDDMVYLLETRHKMSWSYSPENDMFIASVTCKDEESPNYQATVTARHQTPLLATDVLLYKILEVIGSSEWDFAETTDDWG